MAVPPILDWLIEELPTVEQKAAETRCAKLLGTKPTDLGPQLAAAAAFAKGELISPMTRRALYWSNAQNLTLAPSVDQILRTWTNGSLSDADLQCYLSLYGIALPSPDVVRNLYVRDGAQLGLSGPTPGAQQNIWQRVLLQHTWLPQVPDLFALINRGVLSEQTRLLWWRQLGITNQHLRETVEQLRIYMPSPTEIIRYAVREVFNPELVQQLGLTREFPEDFRFWAEKSGILPQVLPDPAAPGKTRTLDVAMAEWISHFVHASPTQSYQGLHRLRPDNIERVRADLKQRLDAEVKAGLSTQAEADELVRGLKPITVSDVARLLKVNDYAPIWRPMLTAISDTPLTRVDIRRMLQVGELTEDELPGRYQDIGYSPSDSQRLAAFTVRLKARSAQQAVIRRSKQQITAAYELGVIGEIEAQAQLVSHGLTEPEAQRAIIGIQLELRVRYVRRAIRVVRDRYRTGAIDDSETEAELRRLSLDPQRIKETLELWRLERTGRAREVSTAQVLSLYREGVIMTAEATLRLGNLGYRTVDIRLLLEQAEKKGAQRSERTRRRATQTAPAPEAEPAAEMSRE